MGDEKTADLENVKKLQLSDAAKKGISIGRKQPSSSNMSKLQAVGKIISKKPARAEHARKL